MATNPNYQRFTWILIILFSALRLFYTTTLQLGADESYYWTYALKLQWNYFDHPPMVAWLIRLTTLNLLLHNEVFVRLGAVIASGIATWVIFRIGTAIKNEQTGWYAAVLYTASVYASTNAGTFIMPDAPLMVFWLAGLLVLIKILQADEDILKSNRLWYWFGLMSGLAIMSKAQGIFLWVGVFLYLLLIDRRWLKHRGIYVAALICLIVTLPILIWNLQHNFVTYKFHSSRINLHSGFTFKYIVKCLVQQFSINNPVNVILIAYGIWRFFKNEYDADKKQIQILLLCGLPIILLVFFISFFREVFPHWSSPGFCCLLILPALQLTANQKNTSRFIPNSLKGALSYLIFLMLLMVVLINHFPGTVSPQKDGLKMGTGDPTLDEYGWTNTAIQFAALYHSDIANHIMSPGAPVLVTNWFPASSIEYYITAVTGQEVLGLGNINDLHQYYWTNHDKKPLKAGDNAYLIIPSHLFYYRNFNLIKSHFKSFNQPLTITQTRSGIPCEYVYVFRFQGYHP